MNDKLNLAETLTFGFEQTFTIEQWWTDETFTAKSDGPLKRSKMHSLALAIADEIGGTYQESQDIWKHIQYEIFDSENRPSFVVTMDPGSIEVKTPPVLFKDIKLMASPLFKAAEKVGLVPYRNWWYGHKGGTEGGCHINMGGFSDCSNPLLKNPDLVVRYAAYLHNRPFLHYPFMGSDVGAEGNAMRMDEKPGYENAQKAFESFNKMRQDHKQLNAHQIYEHFKHTNLVTQKDSFPSLFKFKSPLYLIEDRAQEALRSAEEFELVAKIRLKILQHLQSQQLPESLIQFGEELHAQELTSYSLWGKFQFWANSMDLNPVPYQCFFDRQFPKLLMGVHPPQRFGLKEGKRQRIITEVIKRGDVVVSKKIDTRFKRFELYYYTQDKNELLSFIINASGIEKVSPLIKHQGYLGFGEVGQAFYQYVDIKFDKQTPKLSIELINSQNEVIEQAIFDINNMKWD